MMMMMMMMNDHDQAKIVRIGIIIRACEPLIHRRIGRFMVRGGGSTWPHRPPTR